MSKQSEALRLAQLSEELAADEALLHCWPWPSLAKLYRDDAAELRRLHSVNAELLASLDASRIAIDDWLNTYAKELCDAGRVAEAHKRIRNEGGTVGYIAALQQRNRAAIARATPAPSAQEGK